jgi:hypothetical protein
MDRRFDRRGLWPAALAAVAVLALAGCNGPARTPEQHGKELAARAKALEAEVTKTNSVSPAQQAAFDGLAAEIQAYNKATKRTDLSVEHGTFTPTGGGQPAYSARFIDPGVPGSCTVNCPLFPPNRPPGYFCLPDGASFCDPITGVTVCSYKCVRIPFSGLLSR